MAYGRRDGLRFCLTGGLETREPFGLITLEQVFDFAQVAALQTYQRGQHQITRFVTFGGSGTADHVTQAGQMTQHGVDQLGQTPAIGMPQFAMCFEVLR